jgi:hypothetical protein
MPAGRCQVANYRHLPTPDSHLTEKHASIHHTIKQLSDRMMDDGNGRQ